MLIAGARVAAHRFRKANAIAAPILPLPSDFVLTCTLPSFRGLAGCGAGDAKAQNRILRVQNKDVGTLIGQHGAYWRKGRDERLS